MPTFRKMPVEIEAIKFDGYEASAREIEKAFRAEYEIEGYGADYGGRLVRLRIKTLEGTMTADPGDWIIKGVKGEVYPCKPDIFAATYEAV